MIYGLGIVILKYNLAERTRAVQHSKTRENRCNIEQNYLAINDDLA